jgi:hypothetical protein
MALAAVAIISLIEVVIGMDPHKRSATIEVMDGDETILGGGRYATDIAGYQAMVRFAKRFPDRTWAIEGCNGIGNTSRTGYSPTANRLSTCHRNCPRARECSPPDRAARPMKPMRTPSHLSALG